MLLRVVIAAVLAVLAALAVVDAPLAARGERRARREAPGLASPRRRVVAAGGLAAVFFLALFLPVATLDLQPGEVDLEAIGVVDLFFFQALLALTVIAWGALGWAGLGGGAKALRGWARQVGLAARHPARELAVGLGFGVLAWGFVLAVAAVAAAAVGLFAGEDALAEITATSPLVLWVAAQPLAVRIAVALTAGVVEETFFRGLLQPRIGILASSLLFVLGHLAYGQVMMLVGVAVLSLLYAGLARWRGNVLAAIVAHALFDLVQLLVVIPWAVRAMEQAPDALGPLL